MIYWNSGQPFQEVQISMQSGEDGLIGCLLVDRVGVGDLQEGKIRGYPTSNFQVA
jgi:hypothetical protein